MKEDISLIFFVIPMPRKLVFRGFFLKTFLDFLIGKEF